MILSTQILVTLNNHTKKYYEKIGYKIPLVKIKGVKNPRMKNGTTLLVDIKDLYKGSHAKILCKCDECGKERELEYSQYRDLCHQCATTLAKGIKSATWDFTITEEERQVSRKRYFWPGYNTWKRLVKQKANYVCQCCGYQGKKWEGTIIAHHLNNFNDFPDQRSDINNGFCLCKDCHKKFHSMFGIKHTVKSMMEIFLVKPYEIMTRGISFGKA
jgi:hypothetical protein